LANGDTLATSYALKCAIEKIGKYDIVLCGRQAIDGDTAQVGPQIAEKLKINQLSCVSEIIEINTTSITVKRSVENGYEILKSGLPVLLTITGDANEPRSPSAKRVMAYKKIKNKKDTDSRQDSQTGAVKKGIISHITQWNLESIAADPELCGLSGSPTKVKKIRNVVLTAGDVKQVQANTEGINNLIRELTEEYIIG